jgi:hypothetical protein
VELSQAEVSSVVEAIQLSVAPVFLLSGIGVLLSVLTSRLARVVDRARPMEEKLVTAAGEEREDLLRRLRWLSKRARFANAAITLSTLSALLVAIVVATLFVSAFVEFDLGLVVAGLFVTSMLALVGALVAFLVEVRIATLTIRIGPKEC